MNNKDLNRFLDKVKPIEGCWIWVSSKNSKGYVLKIIQESIEVTIDE